jgi:hypothetical protein
MTSNLENILGDVKINLLQFLKPEKEVINNDAQALVMMSLP